MTNSDAMGVMGVGKAIAEQGVVCLPGRSGKLLGNAPEEIGNYMKLANAVLVLTELAWSLDTAFLNYAAEQAVRTVESYEKGRINDIIHD